MITKYAQAPGAWMVVSETGEYVKASDVVSELSTMNEKLQTIEVGFPVYSEKWEIVSDIRSRLCNLEQRLLGE